MTESISKCISLEFGESPQLRAFSEPAEVRHPGSRSRYSLFVAYSAKIGGSKTKALLRACRSIRSAVWERESFPEWLILLNDDRRISSLAEQMRRASAPARPFDKVFFYCFKSPDHWTVNEKSEFRGELESAIDFLSQLAPETATTDAPINTDSDHQLRLARERRDQLLVDEKWVDAPAVHIQQGGRADSQGINNTASRLRRGGELLGAWNGREFLHPAFQFRPDTGRLMPEMTTLLSLLPEDRSGWRQTLWLFQRHGQLDGERPADMFQRDPDAVIKVARSDFEVSDERW